MTHPGEQGFLQINVGTSGVDPDEDGYLLAVGGRDPVVVGTTDTVIVNGLPRGPVTVGLDDIAINCSMEGDGSFELELESVGPTFHDILVTCIPNEGDLAVSLEVAGPVDDPSGFVVRVAEDTRPVEGNNVDLLFENVRGGEQEIAFEEMASFCRIEDPTTVLVLPGTLTTTDVTVRCAYSVVGRVLFSAQVGGFRLHTVAPNGTDLVPFGDHEIVQGDQLRSSISADGSRIVFWYGRSAIWTIDPDGTNMRPVPNGENASTPSVSPDGGRIAFSRDGDIWIMGFDGSDPEPITSGIGFCHSPSWAPDGDRLAFEVLDGEGGWNVYTIRADGADLTQVTTFDFARDNLDPAFSPDGTKLAFYANATIVTSALDGSEVEQIVDVGWDPSWSPSGRHIAFHSDLHPLGVYVVDVESGAITALSAALPGVHAVHTAWGPPLP